MLELNINPVELLDNSDPEVSRIITLDGGTFRFEHSLQTLAKWEAIYKVPFLTTAEKTHNQWMGYYLCMCLDEGLSVYHITPEVREKLDKYIADSQTATKIQNGNKTSGKKPPIQTAETIYALLTILNIPYECDRWHLNRLFTLMEVVSIKSSPPKKMSRNEIYKRNKELNNKRRAR